MDYYNQLSPTFRHYLRKFVNSYFNGSLLDALEEGNRWQHVDYRQLLLKEASLVEQAFVIYANNIELDEEGEVTTHEYAEKRAAQYILSVCDNSYVVSPPFEDWEVELI